MQVIDFNNDIYKVISKKKYLIPNMDYKSKSERKRNYIREFMCDFGFVQYFKHRKTITSFFEWTQCEQIEYNKYYKILYKDLFENIEDYMDVYKLLYDDQSKRIFSDICFWRMTMQSSYLVDANNLSRDYKQYFDNCVKLSNSEVFVDAGGYDGDTILDLLNEANEWKKVYFYEPDYNNMIRAKDNLSAFQNIEYRLAGLGERIGVAHFENSGNSSSMVADRGRNVINIVDIDDDIIEKISFIKMDIEGQEISALMGAVDHICKDRPVLAICLYHNPEDIHEIPKFIASVVSDYKFYIRHYTVYHGETVLYAIPNER